MIFNFTMLSPETEDFERDYEVYDNMDLLQFHEFICNDLSYDPASFASFFTSNDNWEKLQEYTLMDMQEDDQGVVALPMAGTLLSQVINDDSERMLFMFDIFADRSMHIELNEARDAEDGVRYPRVSYSSEGNPPPQEDAESLMSEDSPFNDMMGEFMDFEGDDSYSDEF